ncbi:MAG: hypothetical protein RSE18_07130 [Acinetobacter sp.]
MKRIDIVFDAYYAKEHPQKTLKDLGVTYEKAVPQSMGDCWWFFGVKNLPSELPSEIKIKDFGDLNKLIGWGLSKDDVDLLTNTNM